MAFYIWWLFRRSHPWPLCRGVRPLALVEISLCRSLNGPGPRPVLDHRMRTEYFAWFWVHLVLSLSVPIWHFGMFDSCVRIARSSFEIHLCELLICRRNERIVWCVFIRSFEFVRLFRRFYSSLHYPNAIFLATIQSIYLSLATQQMMIVVIMVFALSKSPAHEHQSPTV